MKCSHILLGLGTLAMLAQPKLLAYTIDWDDMIANGFPINQPLSGANTATTGSAAYGTANFGLSTTGGVNGFASWTYNVAAEDLDITMYYSQNMYDASTSAAEGPSFYSNSGYEGQNPDRRVTGNTTIRITADRASTVTPVSFVMSFSKPVKFNELILGSLSKVSSSYEHAYIRALSGEAATGSLVKASYFENISDRVNSDGLLIDPFTEDGPDYSASGNTDSNLNIESGIEIDVGTALDDGIYHVAGTDDQGPEGQDYGRVLLRYKDQAIQSMVLTYWASSVSDVDETAASNMTNQWISTTFAASTLEVVPEPSSTTATTFLLALLALIHSRRGIFESVGHK